MVGGLEWIKLDDTDADLQVSRRVVRIGHNARTGLRCKKRMGIVFSKTMSSSGHFFM